MTASVSVIVPARNASRTLAATLESILASPEVLEVLVVDDGSDDGTAGIATGYHDPRVRCLPCQGRGISDGLNTGFRAAKGNFVSRCDADDFYVADRLSWQVTFLRDNADFAAVSSGYRSVTPRRAPVVDLACDGDARDVTEPLLSGTPVTTLCAWLIRREALVATGGARHWFKTAEDLDLQFRLAAQGKVWHRPVVGYEYVLHDASIIHSSPRGENTFYGSAARQFAMQRSQRGEDDLDRGQPPRYEPDSADATDRRTAAHQISRHLTGDAWRMFNAGQTRRGLVTQLRAIRHAPVDAGLWKGLGAMLVKAIKP